MDENKNCSPPFKFWKFGKIFHFWQFLIFFDKTWQDYYLINCYWYFICTIDPGSKTRSPEVIDLFSTLLLQLDNHLNVKSFCCKYMIYKLSEFIYFGYDWPRVKNEVTGGRDPVFGCLAITGEPFIRLLQNLTQILFMDRRVTD